MAELEISPDAEDKPGAAAEKGGSSSEGHPDLLDGHGTADAGPGRGFITVVDGCAIVCETVRGAVGSFPTLCHPPLALTPRVNLPLFLDIAEGPASGRAGVLINWLDYVTPGDRRAMLSHCFRVGKGSLFM